MNQVMTGLYQGAAGTAPRLTALAVDASGQMLTVPAAAVAPTPLTVTEECQDISGAITVPESSYYHLLCKVDGEIKFSSGTTTMVAGMTINKPYTAGITWPGFDVVSGDYSHVFGTIA